MMAELSLLVKATIVLAVALAASRAARRAPASARGLVLASAFGVLLVMPVAGMIARPRVVVIPVASASQSLFFDKELPMAPERLSPTRPGAVDLVPAFAMPSIPVVLRGIWIAGTIVVCVSLIAAAGRLRRLRHCGIRWRGAEATVAAIARAAHVARRVEVILSADIAGPMTWGLVCPVIALPIDAPTWGDSDLRQALVHEIEHIRRRDWLVHVLGRVACAVYWFHPLTWVAWRQLRLECERACDDAVLRGAEQTVYAEQLVMLARRLSNRSALLLSMADRSNLATRIAAVLDTTIARGRTSTAHTAVIVSSAIALAVVIAPLEAVSGPPAGALQPAMAQAPATAGAFEVASIKRNRTSDPARARVEPGGRFTAVNMPLRQIIQQAYGLRAFQILNAPDWTTSQGYDIVAKAPEGVPLGPQAMAPFLRALLRDRFAFSARTETQEMPIYELVTSRPDRKPGPKLQASSADCTGPMPPRAGNSQPDDKPTCALLGTFLGSNSRRYEMRGYPMSNFVQMLGGALDRHVADKTGLSGTWNVELEFSPDGTVNPAPGDPPSIFTALQEQLGLKLEPARGPVDMLVITRVERPTED
jgi:bla regulator protein blaR1